LRLTSSGARLPSGPVEEEVVAWAQALGEERLWALEDCRHVTRGLERTLVERGGRLVRVPPRLTAPQRRRGRTGGKSDSIDALAVARAALQEPSLDGPRAGEAVLHELKLLVDHRDDLVAERRRCQQRLRWHLHELDSALAVPLGALGRCRTLTRSIAELNRELQARTKTLAPRLLELAGCGALSAAKLLCEIGPIERFRSDAQLARHAGVAPLDASSGKHQRHRLDRGGNRQLNCALHRIAVTQGRVHPPARAYLERKQSEGKHAAKQSAASNDNSHAPSTPHSKTSPY
jgi:transposase